MKYTIEGLQQNKLIEWQLNGDDAIILRYIVDFYLTGVMCKTTIDGKEYFWVRYESVINELPILGMTNKEVIARHFSKYCKCGLMERKIKKDNGTYSCFRFVEGKLLDLLTYQNGKTNQIEFPQYRQEKKDCVTYFKDKNTWKEIISEYETFYHSREGKKLIWNQKEFTQLKALCKKINDHYDNANLAFAEIFIALDAHWKYKKTNTAPAIPVPSKVVSDINDLVSIGVKQ